ncbi:MAG: amidohydrolase [Chloroflexi bacterium]|nr:amidohydrolase [Chloroflexota bacterium]
MALPNTVDAIFHNGRVLTVDRVNTVQQAISIQGGKIHAVGTDEEVLVGSSSKTDVIDLGGRTLIPGIVDIHAHLDREGLKGVCPSLEGAQSVSDILAIIRSLVDRTNPGEWIVTMPIGEPPNYADVPGKLAEKRFPTRWDLDAVAPNNPVYIRGIWTPWNVPPSVSIANSAALAMAGLDRATASPDSSITIEHDSAGEPTGIIQDFNRFPAVEFTLMRVVPRFAHRDRVEALKSSMGSYNSVGTTGIYEGHGVAPEVLNAYREVWDAGEMTVRARLVVSPEWRSAKEAQKEWSRWAHAASGPGLGDDMLRISGCYIGYGGSRFTARARGSELPYTGWAGFVDSYHPPSLYRNLVWLAAQYNVRVHTIVRGLLEEVLGVFEEVNEAFPLAGKRWILEHTLDTSLSQLQRIRQLGLVVETIPLTEIWLRGGMNLKEPAVARRATAHRSYQEHGIPYGLGTDNKPYNPFMTIWAAVARKERLTGEVLGPEQRIDRMDALRAFTLGGAYFSFDERVRGSLEPGKQADLAVLSDDFLDIDQDRLPDLVSLLTIVGGRIVHGSERF